MSLWSSSQASKKASNKRQRGAQKSCSNVFSMFEQSQIQEFKEVQSSFPAFTQLPLKPFLEDVCVGIFIDDIKEKP